MVTFLSRRRYRSHYAKSVLTFMEGVARPIEIPYATGFRYYVDGPACWMLLQGLGRTKSL